MTGHIILLSSIYDALYLTTILNIHNPALTISVAPDREMLEDCLAAAPDNVRLIGFCTPVVVPAGMLQRLPGPAYNIHPGSRQYPGKYPAAFALYDRAPWFGATAHEMAAKVDSGPIVGVVDFEVPPQSTMAWLGERAHRAAFRLFVGLAPALVNLSAPLDRLKLTWGHRRSTQRLLDTLCILPPGLDEEELERRIAAFSSTPGVCFQTFLHGRRFVLDPQ